MGTKEDVDAVWRVLSGAHLASPIHRVGQAGDGSKRPVPAVGSEVEAKCGRFAHVLVFDDAAGRSHSAAEMCRDGDLLWWPRVDQKEEALCVLLVREGDPLRGAVLRSGGQQQAQVCGAVTIEADAVVLSTAAGVRWDMVTAMVEAPPTPPQPAA